MEKYFGFRVYINNDLDPADELEIQEIAKKWIAEDDVDLTQFNVYIHQLIIKAEEEHFGVPGGLANRIRKINLEFRVNQKQIRSRGIRFRNHVISSFHSEEVKPYFQPTWIGYEIPVGFFERSNYFQNAIIAIVKRGVREDHRKIKVNVTADPHPSYLPLITNRNNADSETSLDLRFTGDVQLRLPFRGEITSIRNDKPEGTSGTTYINNGVAIGFGHEAKAHDFYVDQRVLSQLGALSEHANAEGKPEEAQILDEAVQAGNEGSHMKVMDKLRAVGSWGAEAATRLSLSAAETAIKAAINAQF